MKRFHIGRFLFQCNVGKEKGIPVMNIFRCLFCMMFSDRSIYMQMMTGTFGGEFSKNTIYSFLNDARVNWQRFTTLLSAANDKNLICGGNRMTAGPLPEGDASRRGGKPQMLWWS